MKRISYILPALFMFAVAGCSQTARNTDEKTTIDSTTVSTPAIADTALTAKMLLPKNLIAGAPIELTFTVYNQTDSARTFCKWHTPFEPLMSKYLDVTSSNGEEVLYSGPMAKRMMPPPASSYVSVKPGDSLSIKVDLLKAYQLKNPGTYVVRYNSESISGLKVPDSLSLIIK